MKKINEIGRIMPRMVSAKEAGAMKEAGIAVKDVLDVGMVFMIRPEDAGLTAEELGIPKKLFDFAKIRVNEEMLQEAGVTIDEVYEKAKEDFWGRAGEEASRAVKLGSAMKQLGDDCGEPLPDFMTEDRNDLYVVPYMVQNGAVILAEPDAFRHIAEVLQSDLYILPSSRHEVIIVPVNIEEQHADTEEFQDIVKNVNAMMAQEDVLSDSVYCFTRETGQLTVLLQG